MLNTPSVWQQSKEDVGSDKIQTENKTAPLENVDTDPEQDNESMTSTFAGEDPFMNTYAVYTELVDAGFSPQEANSVLDLVITQLNQKLRTLVDKHTTLGEAENEQYLFESALEELRVDIAYSRQEHINELLSLINILERDFHVILNELDSSFISMRNDSQVAINDQKSENTLMLKRIILKIQETNHKITTELNLPIKSEIESLRWHLSRWGLILILVVVFSGCATFYIYKTRQEKKVIKQEQFVPLVIREPSEYDEDEYDADADPDRAK